MKRLLVLSLLLSAALTLRATGTIPLPEHPRPDFERAEWINLNGQWAFTFDEAVAVGATTSGDLSGFKERILVPFPWGSKLSGVADGGDKASYGRQITIPESWKGKRVFLVVGASDWETNAWLDGKPLGVHQGGYTPFEFELTGSMRCGSPQTLIISADDTPNNQHLSGKQGYGNARGIWQTVYLEARGTNYVDHVHFSPDIDRAVVKVEVALSEKPAKDASLELVFKNGERAVFTHKIAGKAAQSKTQTFEVPIPNQRLWSLEDPYLYETTVVLKEGGAKSDQVDSYFGQRKISVMDLPGLEFPYIALNNKPIYLEMCLDQSYHPEGFYTFPSDEFMKNEILISKKLGLNGNRIHIKVELPRKLYWADKLGLLIMADVPNFWGEPKEEARRDWEYCMREQVKRDYNHPSIFSWVDFNESWGLWTDNTGYQNRKYLPETQQWVRQMYFETKKLDPTRLVEDNSVCNLNHVQTDINSWHHYLPGWLWDEYLDKYDNETYPGSTFNYIGGNKQGREPMMNSECGNVWGYTGSAGNSDYTWDYHILINGFRAHPKICGWLYTEHHDVINEWNGYVKYDRSPKIDGLCELVPGMSLADFHAPYYISPRIGLCTDAKAGETVSVPLFASFMTDRDPGQLTLKTQLVGWNSLGDYETLQSAECAVPFAPWLNRLIDPLTVKLPEAKGLYLLQMFLTDPAGQVLQRNFVTFRVKEGSDPVLDKVQLVTFRADSHRTDQWSVKRASVLDGLKENGFGYGYFEYRITWPQGCKLADLASATLRFEASAKQLFGKDVKDMEEKVDLDYMLGGGTHDDCKSPNSYAMTDEELYESWVQVSVNGTVAGMYCLPDDPADHRGILSWHSQPRERRMSEAGSYGYLIDAELPLEALKEGEEIVLRLEVPQGIAHGLAIYGQDFGRYPLDPTLIFVKK